ncbi:DedA family protein [Legionella israelensis]|uniref:DedA family protein n=1 Tax=Legionella israelensis TaxID=454 RepID=A0A0W0VH56_9GAMM|nr:YqaA family protein [Legionella israelensis]KTD19518.1 putative membrane protein [Legionella israelensis]QBR84396.1 DedA family protein [Legionella israelensis]QBS08671.1 DedA family protein [Legionella israelensis]QDP72496.1 DedA family protein [Legionella israelensis]SCY38253.1 membrane protein YqaA, SNARE-associated domain [Legionella israelensis DSM 19235]
MKFFSTLYQKTIAWSQHRHAPYYLAAVSFAESSFFPIPPDVMLLSMGLAKPEKAWQYALITTLFSVIGGILGYCIGWFSIKFIYTYLVYFHYEDSYQQVVSWFQYYGVWMIFLAGFSPIPYKLFTIAAGALQMAFFPFLLASIIGRGLRFYLVSTIMYLYGAKLHNGLGKYIDVIGWSSVIVFVIVFLIMKWLY